MPEEIDDVLWWLAGEINNEDRLPKVSPSVAILDPVPPFE